MGTTLGQRIRGQITTGRTYDLIMKVFESRAATVGDSTVSRALPQREHRTVGAWCFLDHFGPSEPGAADGISVGPHPHCGLATVTWLIRGSAVHTDSLGSEQLIEPGQLNLMTAGRGIAHAEQTPIDRRGELHGVQFWVAQPEATRHSTPAFEHHAALPKMEIGSFSATVLLGSFGGVASPARSDTRLVGVELNGTSKSGTELGLEPCLAPRGGGGGRRHPHHRSTIVEPGTIVYMDVGTPSVHLAIDEPTRWMLIGGEPFEAPVKMWWNFVGRTHEEMTEAVTMWNEGNDRFGEVRSALGRIAAPVTPW